MIKVAVFTEGQTEQMFVCEAIRQLSNGNKYYAKNQRKNGKGSRLIKMDYGSIGDPDDHDIYFQILNCDSDNQVLSTIREEYPTLVAAGFTHIIGMRDVRPIPRDKMAMLLASVAARTPAGVVAPLMVVAILEAEAWLIAENSHFLKIDPSLTHTKIMADTGIDITSDSENFDTPFETLQQIYASAGKQYTKSMDDLLATISVLDMNEFDGAAGDRAATLKPLIGKIREIFA